ncbi:MAG TPA: glycoside hydrolase family 104 protein [Chitinophagales bacterium]|nr:glycoside hydrolase family 104 protein [Chitinophagales bacterium]HMW12313.1 glycoside hydrolase family 104 protein [Chitinophagales bacterium]HMX59779.1 glycoside hydrolase family 104 protein [Chitinophagales bacterium]HMY22587.1 glycoside hydrolase family 104 protein [Chitinophagales bacterium]HMZ33435.1 glycoside hydrolase family 104 protein [Chitinophagales bacterium]
MSVENNNVQAFLKMIRYAEGTAGENGYRTLFGGKLFNDFSKHPNIKVPFFNKLKGKTDYSTAAGAYQFIRPTWLEVSTKLGLSDFSPASQDKAAVEKIRQRGGLDYVIAGEFDKAVDKVKLEWASMPGAGYKQPEKKLAELKKIYVQHGGKFA